MTGETAVADHILALERAALDRWGAGDPSGYLEICAPDVVYFDPFLPGPLLGLPAVAEYYEGIRGQVRIERDEVVNPIVQVRGEMAVLAFNYVSQSGQNEARWNCTEVYRLCGEDWRICQTHWSFTQRGG